MNKGIFYKKATSLLFDTSLVGTRFTLAISEFFWAISLLWYGGIFDRTLYAVMAGVFIEEIWGSIFLFSAVLQAYIAVSGNTETRFARIFAGWNAGLWLYIVVSLYVSVYPPPAAVSGDAALALAAVWIWFRPFILDKGRAYARNSTSGVQ